MRRLSRLPSFCGTFLTCSRRVGKKPREDFDCKKGTNKKGLNEVCPLLLSRRWPHLAEGHLESFQRTSEGFLGATWGTIRGVCRRFELFCSLHPTSARQIAPATCLPPASLASALPFGDKQQAGCCGCAESSGCSFLNIISSKYSCVLLLRKQEVVQAGRHSSSLSPWYCVLTRGGVSWDEWEGSGNSHHSPTCSAFWSQ